MLAANWFTPNPYTTEARISASKSSNFERGFHSMKDTTWSKWVDELEPIFKKKWLSNGIYKLIMMTKTTIPIKHELFTTTLLFWNIGTNIFDFRKGPMSHTILDMA